MMMAKFFLAIAPILAGIAVAAGAFAAHALKSKLSESALEIFETGARYQMYHALGLLLIGILLLIAPSGQAWMTTAGFAFLAGIVLFSGSLYGLSLTGMKWLGPITPLGGIAFMLGWGCLAIAALSFKV